MGKRAAVAALGLGAFVAFFAKCECTIHDWSHTSQEAHSEIGLPLITKDIFIGEPTPQVDFRAIILGKIDSPHGLREVVNNSSRKDGLARPEVGLSLVGINVIHNEFGARVVNLDRSSQMDVSGRGLPAVNELHNDARLVLVGIDKVGGGNLDVGPELLSGSLVGSIHQIPCRPPKQPSSDAKNDGKNCDNAVPVCMGKLAKAKTKTDQQLIEAGDLVLKGVGGVICIMLMQTLLKRW